MAYKDDYNYVRKEAELKKLITGMFASGVSYVEIMHLVERVIFSYCFCQKGYTNLHTAELLGLLPQKCAQIRDSFSFTYFLTGTTKEQKVAAAPVSIDELAEIAKRRALAKQNKTPT